MFGRGIRQGDPLSLSAFEGSFGCTVQQWPLKYLGMPLGGNPRSISFWDLVVERVNKKLVRWKKFYISLGGRITLIKAAMSNVPVYHMSLYKMPLKVIMVLGKCQRDACETFFGRVARKKNTIW